jgi:hypothetical protein
MDLPLDQQPQRLNQLLPGDFQEGGRFFNLELPFFPPIPADILNFVFGDGRQQLSNQASLRLLEELHALRGVHVKFCGCGGRILQKGTLPINIPTQGGRLNEFDSLV